MSGRPTALPKYICLLVGLLTVTFFIPPWKEFARATRDGVFGPVLGQIYIYLYVQSIMNDMISGM